MTMKFELFHAVHNIFYSTIRCYEQVFPVLAKKPGTPTDIHKLLQFFGIVCYEHEH